MAAGHKFSRAANLSRNITLSLYRQVKMAGRYFQTETAFTVPPLPRAGQGKGRHLASRQYHRPTADALSTRNWLRVGYPARTARPREERSAGRLCAGRVPQNCSRDPLVSEPLLCVCGAPSGPAPGSTSPAEYELLGCSLHCRGSPQRIDLFPSPCVATQTVEFL